jgi:hypothetical protein
VGWLITGSTDVQVFQVDGFRQVYRSFPPRGIGRPGHLVSELLGPPVTEQHTSSGLEVQHFRYGYLTWNGTQGFRVYVRPGVAGAAQPDPPPASSAR